eukprot:11205801-Lingulodinium_polyedra.AAC.1
MFSRQACLQRGVCADSVRVVLTGGACGPASVDLLHRSCAAVVLRRGCRLLPVAFNGIFP